MTNRDTKHTRRTNADYWVRLASSGVRYPVLLLLSLTALISSAAQTANDWLMFRGSPARIGITSAQLPEQLKLRWNFQAGDSIESSAAITAGLVYVGCMDASLYAVDLASGKQRWRYAAAGPIEESSPCVHEGVVYVGDLNGVLHAVDAATGKARWTFKAEAEIRSSPACVGNRVYFGSYDQNLYCLSAERGTLIWKFTTQGPVHCSPAIEKGYIYISGCDATFRAIDASSGKQTFTINLGDYTGASAAIFDSHAYVGTFGNEVLGLDLQRKTPEWVYSHPTRSFPFYSSAAVTASRVVLGGRDKIIHCLERATGKEIWTFRTQARVESSPLITENRVFVGSNDGRLYELDLVSGRKIWDFTSGAPFSASPAAVGNSLVIGDQDGVLYCFGN